MIFGNRSQRRIAAVSDHGYNCNDATMQRFNASTDIDVFDCSAQKRPT